MAICEFCIDTLFKAPYWKPKEKHHHTDSTTWKDSISTCTICSSLLESVRDVIVRNMESHISNMVDSYLRFEPLMNAGILWALKEALPIYKVVLRESGARGQFTLIFEPVKENIMRIDILTPFGKVHDLVLPVRKFQVYSTIYDKEDIPRLSNETSLDEKENKRNARTFSQIKTWVNSCNESHEHCKHFKKQDGKQSFVPTRLIEVGKEGQNHVKVVETYGKARFRQYASLSHCWGGFITTCTYDYNYEQHKKGITLDANFPRNFLDAINLCRSLDIGYVWIDSLCIIQENDADWAKEAPKMHEVYGSSYLNIAATSARNSTEGLFRKRRINLLSPSIVPCYWQGHNRYCKVIREDFWSGELLAEPLYKRAWVAQERMLAPRTLNFGTKQLFWQCLTITACETMPKGIPAVVKMAGREELQWRRLLQQSREDKARDPNQPHPTDKDRKPGEVENNDKVELQEVWRDAVKNYTSCNITNTGDKLPAVAGLAQVMHDCCQEDYVAGLWTEKEEYHMPEQRSFDTLDRSGEKLVLQMAWRVKDCKNVAGKPSRRQRPDEYRAPTWAWPSVVDGVIEIPRRVNDRATLVDMVPTGKAELKYKEKDTEPTHKFMSLNGGWLNVTGHLYTVRFYDVQDAETPCWYWHLPHVPANEKPWVYMYPDEPFHFPDTASALSVDLQNANAVPLHTQSIETSLEASTHAQNSEKKTEAASLFSQSAETSSDFTDRNPRPFIILPLFYKDDEGYFSGRALVVEEELEKTKYKHIPAAEKRHAMFTRIGLVEFRKVPQSLWDYFREMPYEVKNPQAGQRGEDGRINLTLL